MLTNEELKILQPTIKHFMIEQEKMTLAMEEAGFIFNENEDNFCATITDDFIREKENNLHHKERIATVVEGLYSCYTTTNEEKQTCLKLKNIVKELSIEKKDDAEKYLALFNLLNIDSTAKLNWF